MSTRRINATTKVRIKRTSKGYKITVIGGEFDGKSSTMTEAVAIRVSPRTVMNPRTVGREVIRRLREKAEV